MILITFWGNKSQLHGKLHYFQPPSQHILTTTPCLLPSLVRPNNDLLICPTRSKPQQVAVHSVPRALAYLGLRIWDLHVFTMIYLLKFWTGKMLILKRDNGNNVLLVIIEGPVWYTIYHPLPVVIRGKHTPLLINQPMGIWDIFLGRMFHPDRESPQ